MAKTRTIRIKNLLRNLGVPPHILGYIYSAEAINYMVSCPNKTLLINDVYAHVAAIYTTSQICVEASIRNAVKKAYQSNNALFNELFKNEKVIGNHIFLTTLRDIFEEKNLDYIAQQLEYIYTM
ncbi:MAG: hypothetical protein IKE05_01715 [Clostridia bacterium]|nr:hypothetical protein [Clostridia bacterium]